MKVRSKTLATAAFVTACGLLPAAPAMAITCSGPYYIESISTTTTGERSPIGAGRGTLNIVTKDGNGILKNWSSAGYGELFAPSTATDIDKAKTIQIQATHELAILAYKTGAWIYPTVSGTSCNASVTVSNRAWVTGLNGLWIMEPQ